MCLIPGPLIFLLDYSVTEKKSGLLSTYRSKAGGTAKTEAQKLPDLPQVLLS